MSEISPSETDREIANILTLMNDTMTQATIALAAAYAKIAILERENEIYRADRERAAEQLHRLDQLRRGVTP
jgi:hypothetical protein